MGKFRVKELAQARGLTQEALWLQVKAQGTSISMGTIQRLWQNDRASEPRLSTMLAIAKALGVSVEDLYTEEKESYNPKQQQTPGLAAA